MYISYRETFKFYNMSMNFISSDYSGSTTVSWNMTNSPGAGVLNEISLLVVKILLLLLRT